MVQASSELLTLDEFLRLPETKPAHDFIDGQIIDGQIIQKTMP
ncbi:hypothetical protein OXH18_10615 [Thermocoleostomius sinensis A174]|uniref:Uma2 family endonuclease n=1 Tax=Thermocoleostomius sinensis A174 TaxID=2016057 RepID=A0A9E8ZGD2_9CYAN|nr:hypothetical protein OXH18_10615 [Thermocoleostomius sinensis A174]